MSAPAWLYATHPETGGETRLPNDPGVVAAFTARGWTTHEEMPEHLDPEAPNLGAAPLQEPAVDEAAAADPANTSAPVAQTGPDTTATEAGGAAVTTDKETKNRA